MKVRLFQKVNEWYDARHYLELNFPAVPMVGDFIQVDWTKVRDAIIEAKQVSAYKEFVKMPSREWYDKKELQKTAPQPSVEELKRDFCFEELGEVVMVRWTAFEGEIDADVVVGPISKDNDKEWRGE